MPIPIPNLDDRTFDQLAAEARSLIPKNFPAWTDLNSSDPGTTLLELFAFLAESAMYEINRVPDRSLEKFAALVGISPLAGEALEGTLARALAAATPAYRAVTDSEFESLAITDFAQFAAANFTDADVPEMSLPAAPAIIARATVVVEFVKSARVFPQDQFIRLIVVPNDPSSSQPQPSPALCEKLFEFLQPRRLITTRVQVSGPVYTSVPIAVEIVRDADTPVARDALSQTVAQAIASFLSPLTGGAAGIGWPFGRSVFRSELCQLIEGIAGVDHVKRMRLNNQDDAAEGRLSSALSLVNCAASSFSVTVSDV